MHVTCIEGELFPPKFNYGVVLGDTQVRILLYADDIVLLSESEHDLQRHLNALDDFCTQRGLVVNLGKTKVLIFHTSAQVRAQSRWLDHTSIS